MAQENQVLSQRPPSPSATKSPSPSLRYLFLAYALSGFIGLGYQVFWFRFFVDRFGANILTFTLVVVNFIGGLGLGAWFSRELSDVCSKLFRITHPLRLYGAIEIVLAALLLLTPLLRLVPSDLFGSFPYHLHDGIYYLTLGSRLFQAIASSATIFLPCVVMGMTFPLLCRTFPDVPRFPSSLYAWNTLGACASVLICEFMLIPNLGHVITFVLVWILNVALGIYFIRTEFTLPEAAQPAKKSPAQNPTSSNSESLSTGAMILGSLLGGLAAGTLEAGMHQIISFQGFSFAVAMSFITFWAILAIFLSSWTVHAAKFMNLKLIKIAYGLAAVIYTVIRYSFYSISEVIQNSRLDYLARAAEEGSSPSLLMNNLVGLGAIWLFVGIVVFPTCYLVSLLLPHICNVAQSRGLGVERFYALNTIAFCIGMLVFSRLTPLLSIFYSIKLHAVCFVLVAVLVTLMRTDRPTEKWKYAAVGALALLFALFTGRGFDRDFFPSGSPLRSSPISALKSNGVHTTYVVQLPDSKSLYFDSHSMSANSPGDQGYMRLMAHFPLLAHPNPESALLICFGVGNTASAITAHSSIKTLDIVDLNDKVIQTAPEFAETNFKVYEDPRVTFITDDGRHFLDVTDRSYDLITSEPPPPIHTGIYRLYSKEYYESVLDHLTPEGIMTQWLPLNQLSSAATDLIVSAFNQSFPHSLLFVGRSDHLILVGSRTPLNLERMKQRFKTDAEVVDDLAICLIATPELLWVRIVQSDAMLDRRFGDRTALSDHGAELSHYAFSGFAPFFEHDSAKLAADLFSPNSDSEKYFLRATASLEVLQQNVPDFPVKNIKFIPRSDSN